ncbi:MAG: zf-HC2 domain-containing protein, partial [Actinobacteria bacterium]|nr:zf-HC2 domain-containing protein [Actinomycetota bacterium]
MSSASDGHLGDLLSALLDRELSPAEEVAARRHLETCAFCTTELSEVETARSWVRGLPAVDPPFGFLERLTLDAGRLGLPRSSTRRRVGVAALAASAAAGVALLGLAPPR